MRIAARTVYLIVISSMVSISAADAYGFLSWIKARLPSEEVPFLESTSDTFRVDVVAEGLESPWAVVPASRDRLLITERPGRLRVVEQGRLLPGSVSGVPRVAYQGQGGLLDIALHLDYATNRMIYLAYTVETDSGLMTRVTRFEETAQGLKNPLVIFPGVPGSHKAKHFGCRIRFGVDRKLYITLGKRGEGWRAQDLMDLNGKTLRLNEDGSIPAIIHFPDERTRVQRYVPGATVTLKVWRSIPRLVSSSRPSTVPPGMTRPGAETR